MAGEANHDQVVSCDTHCERKLNPDILRSALWRMPLLRSYITCRLPSTHISSILHTTAHNPGVGKHLQDSVRHARVSALRKIVINSSPLLMLSPADVHCPKSKQFGDHDLQASTTDLHMERPCHVALSIGGPPCWAGMHHW